MERTIKIKINCDGSAEYLKEWGIEKIVYPSGFEYNARIFAYAFGSKLMQETKGYKVLNPKIGLIYGDGMYLERYKETLRIMEEMGYAASNLVIGVGGILRNVHHGRDFLGFAIKSTYVEINNAPLNIEKDPITDSAKKSHKGLLKLEKTKDGYVTIEKCSKEQEEEGELKIVYCRS